MFYFEESMLLELKSAMFGSNNDDIAVDNENRTVNYNECGDSYYYIDTYTNNMVKGIMICARNDDISSYVEICCDENDNNIFDLIDKILERNDELEEILTKKFEENARKKH